jgi:hypothetical protein
MHEGEWPGTHRGHFTPTPPPQPMPIGREFGWDPVSVRIVGRKMSLPLQRIEPSLPGLPTFSQCAHEAVFSARTFFFYMAP